MVVIYLARYKDQVGEEQTSISNDGKKLTMIVRGIRFEGDDFDSFRPSEDSDAAQLSPFTLANGELCSCLIEAEIPVSVVTPIEILDGLLTAELELGKPLANGGIDKERLKLRLAGKEQSYWSNGTTGWFEDELLDLQRQLPFGTYLRICFHCAFSDYSPVGHGLFGGLACFRGNKTGYRSVSSKKDIFAIWDTMTEFVQETYLCPEFEKRTLGTGYRG